MFGKIHFGRLLVATIVFLAAVMIIPVAVMIIAYGITPDFAALLFSSGVIFLYFGLVCLLIPYPRLLLRLIPDGTYMGKVRRWLMPSSIPKTNPMHSARNGYPMQVRSFELVYQIPQDEK